MVFKVKHVLQSAQPDNFAFTGLFMIFKLVVFIR
jgi:hypothetical protein